MKIPGLVCRSHKMSPQSSWWYKSFRDVHCHWTTTNSGKNPEFRWRAIASSHILCQWRDTRELRSCVSYSCHPLILLTAIYLSTGKSLKAVSFCWAQHGSQRRSRFNRLLMLLERLPFHSIDVSHNFQRWTKLHVHSDHHVFLSEKH